MTSMTFNVNQNGMRYESQATSLERYCSSVPKPTVYNNRDDDIFVGKTMIHQKMQPTRECTIKPIEVYVVLNPLRQKDTNDQNKAICNLLSQLPSTSRRYFKTMAIEKLPRVPLWMPEPPFAVDHAIPVSRDGVPAVIYYDNLTEMLQKAIRLGNTKVTVEKSLMVAYMCIEKVYGENGELIDHSTRTYAVETVDRACKCIDCKTNCLAVKLPTGIVSPLCFASSSSSPSSSSTTAPSACSTSKSKSCMCPHSASPSTCNSNKSKCCGSLITQDVCCCEYCVSTKLRMNMTRQSVDHNPCNCDRCTQYDDKSDDNHKKYCSCDAACICKVQARSRNLVPRGGYNRCKSMCYPQTCVRIAESRAIVDSITPTPQTIEAIEKDKEMGKNAPWSLLGSFKQFADKYKMDYDNITRPTTPILIPLPVPTPTPTPAASTIGISISPEVARVLAKNTVDKSKSASDTAAVGTSTSITSTSSSTSTVTIATTPATLDTSQNAPQPNNNSARSIKSRMKPKQKPNGGGKIPFVSWAANLLHFGGGNNKK